MIKCLDYQACNFATCLPINRNNFLSSSHHWDLVGCSSGVTLSPSLFSHPHVICYCHAKMLKFIYVFELTGCLHLFNHGSDTKTLIWAFFLEIEQMKSMHRMNPQFFPDLNMRLCFDFADRSLLWVTGLTGCRSFLFLFLYSKRKWNNEYQWPFLHSSVRRGQRVLPSS